MNLRTAAQAKAAVEHALKTQGGCGAAGCLLDPQPGSMRASCSCDGKKVRVALFWVRQVLKDVAPPSEIEAGAVSKLRSAAAGVPVAADNTSCASDVLREYTLEERRGSDDLVCIGCGAASEEALITEAAAQQLDAMPDALREMVALAHEYLDEAVCNHAMGECWCAQAAELRRAEALLPSRVQ